MPPQRSFCISKPGKYFCSLLLFPGKKSRSRSTRLHNVMQVQSRNDTVGADYCGRIEYARPLRPPNLASSLYRINVSTCLKSSCLFSLFESVLKGQKGMIVKWVAVSVGDVSQMAMVVI